MVYFLLKKGGVARNRESFSALRACVCRRQVSNELMTFSGANFYIFSQTIWSKISEKGKSLSTTTRVSIHLHLGRVVVIMSGGSIGPRLLLLVAVVVVVVGQEGENNGDVRGASVCLGQRGGQHTRFMT